MTEPQPHPDPIRPRPEIVRVPPRPQSKLVLLILGVLSLTCFFVGTGLAFSNPAGLLGPGSFLMGLGMLLATVGFVSQRRAGSARRRFFAAYGQAWRNPASESLDAQWTNASLPPSAAAVRQAVAPWRRGQAPGASIVCLGVLEAAEIGEYYFQPEIITPTRWMGYRLIWIPCGLLLLALYAAQSVHLLPGGARIDVFNYVTIMAVITAIAWIWNTGVQPKYIRLAPGMIQIMQFGTRRRKPEIRSYPMDADTLVIVLGGRRVRKLTLVRGAQSDDLDLSQMALPESSRRRLWEALLSTAPTPPLSDEELLG